MPIFREAVQIMLPGRAVSPGLRVRLATICGIPKTSFYQLDDDGFYSPMSTGSLEDRNSSPGRELEPDAG